MSLGYILLIILIISLLGGFSGRFGGYGYGFGNGGVGVLVYDMDRGYAFVRRIPSQDVPPGAAPENVKGI